MSEEEALLAAVYANPDDDTPRLVYADWLDEHGQPERAEFIRMQVRYAAREGPRDGESDRLQKRYYELLNSHEQTWLTEFGLFDPKKVHLDFHRGLVDKIGIYGGNSADLAILRRIPSVRRIELCECSLTQETVGHIAALQGLEYLHISQTAFEKEWLSDLDSLPCWTVIRFPDYDELREAFGAFQERRISRVKELPSAQRRCAAIRFIRAIEGRDRTGAFRPDRPVTDVVFQQVWVQDAELQLLAYLPELESLYILDGEVTSTGLQHLSNLPNLRSVEISKVYADSITPLTRCASLETLEFRSMWSEFGDEGTEGLEQLINLQHLVLWNGEPFGEATLRRICELRGLRTLEIDFDLEEEHSLSALLNLTKLESLKLNDREWHGGDLQRFLGNLRRQ